MTDDIVNANFPENREYWEAIEKGELLVKRCTECKKPHYYPRGYCPFCGSAATAWETSSSEGEIYSFTVVRYGATPYCPAYVTLDDGPTMMTTIVDCEPDTLEIGARVRLVFRQGTNGKLLPMFTPTE